jgi:alcohol dehydrogenase
MEMDANIHIERSNTPREIPGSRVRIAFGAGTLNHLGEIAASLGGQRVLLVSDAGIVAAGHVERAVRSLYQAKVMVRVFDSVEENPTTVHVDRGLRAAQSFKPDMIVGLGGGSSMDCAKGVNFLLSNGGTMQNYWGINKATAPMLPMIAIPTTAGTGSEAQSFALITDPATHQKMACGDSKALPRVAILDPELTATQPPRVAAATGIDAVAHAVETCATTKRTEVSRRFSRAAWQLLESSFEQSMRDPTNIGAREQMQVGAHLAGAAIENSMLGAAHALANALTAQFGIVHGVAVGLMLPHVIRFNGMTDAPYEDLGLSAIDLSHRVAAMLEAGGIPSRLRDLSVMPDAADPLAAIAAKQWTATFNPRPVDEAALRAIFVAAM